jgi:ketosteroid isomerase-like protein
MSQENMEIVREQFEATNRGEFARPMAYWADDIELVVEVGLNSGTYIGRDTVGDWFGDWFRMFGGGVHFDLREMRGAGDAVAVAADHSVRGSRSGIELTETFYYEYRLRDGRIVRIRFHPSWREALEAVGLSEQEAHPDTA